MSLPIQPHEALPNSLLLVGAGKMGTAMLRGWLALGLEGRNISIAEPAPSVELMALTAQYGCALTPSPTPPQVLVLAVKPQMLDGAAPGLRPSVSEKTLLISILAGKTIANLKAHFPNALGLVRAMPNLPGAVGRGMTGLVAGLPIGETERATAEALMRAIGEIEWLANEDQLDSMTAVSGSGPAYIFYLVEALAAAGVKAGLEEAAAMRFARATLEGSAELLRREPSQSPAELRESVTSKGGTTAAALEVLMGPDGLKPLIEKAVLAALARAKALSG